jgi:prefoldin subunit 5
MYEDFCVEINAGFSVEEALEGIDLSDIEGDIANLKATTSTHTENISQLQLTSTSINNEVSSLKETTTTISNELGEIVATQNTIQEDVSSLQLTSSQINASVSSVEQKVTNVETQLEDTNNAVNTRIDSLAKDVSLKLDKQGVEIAIESTLSEGVDKVVTASKKYSFDDEGLKVSSSDSEFSTEVTENGMRIYKHDTEVLTVDNQGVQAADLHARTFLIIGENSRLEDRGNRTACFWIGPAGG